MTWTIGPPTNLTRVPLRNYTVARALSDLEFARSIQVKKPSAWIGAAAKEVDDG